MRKYETVIIFDPTLDLEAVRANVEKFKGIIATNGEVTNVDEWGKRKLAYEVKGFNEGNYVLVEFEAESTEVDELERIYKISDAVIRYLIVRKDEE